MKLTQLEKDMLGQGLASVRIVATKIRRNTATVQRMVAAGHLSAKEIGSQKFIPIESVAEHMGPDGVRLLNLNDWSDILRQDEG